MLTPLGPMPASPSELPTPSRGTTARDEIADRLRAEMAVAFGRAGGDERTLRDVVFRFACHARAAALTPGAVAYALGTSLAESSLTLAERAAALRFFPGCDELAARAERHAVGQPAWWQCWRLDVWRPHDVGSHPFI